MDKVQQRIERKKNSRFNIKLNLLKLFADIHHVL